MVVHRQGVEHRQFIDIGEYLHPGDLLIINDTKVIKARLRAKKDSGGDASLLIERIETERIALCQVRVSKPLKPGRQLHIEDQIVNVVEREGEFYRLEFPQPLLTFLETYGTVPLPPYIRRHTKSSDLDRYQTVFAQKEGAVAAPTAGLHFDSKVLDLLKEKGVQICNITLHVGSGTFQPIRVSNLDQVQLHQERFEIPATTISSIKSTSGRVIAVGTTVVRTLESWARTGETSGETSLFIKPGFEYRVVDALITNFHLPESSLLMLVAAFAGKNRILSAYREAVTNRYKFFSYGDAMFLPKRYV